MSLSPEDWYTSIAPLLRTIAVRKFGVPRDDAEALVHDVFMSFLQRRDAIGNVRTWFIGAISHACRNYWRKQDRILTGEVVERVVEPPEIERVTAHEVLRALPPREQHVLWLRFAEGFTVREVAQAIGRSVSRTEKLLRRARLRAIAVVTPEADEEESAHRWTHGRRCRQNRHFSVLMPSAIRHLVL
jgi:RNA polymerase sigma-70 factor (ECF subfamily)